MHPVPVKDDLPKAYRAYFTHGRPPVGGRLRRVAEAVRGGYLRAGLGHTRGVGPGWYRWLAPLAALHPGGGEEAAAEVIFLGPPPAGARLLDVGCGSGELLLRLRALGWEGEGTEVDDRAIDVARAAGLTVFRGELAERGFPDDAFDITHLGHTIEHMLDPFGTLRECRRVLKPGGKLVVFTPNARSWGHRHFRHDWRGLEPPRHLQVFDPHNLGVAVRRAGFARVEVRTLQRKSRTVLVMSAMIRHCRRTGRSMEGCYNVCWKVLGVSSQLFERALIRFDPQAGEELYCTARKD
jgi:SAM-dependent methyltransferase